jgi:hypothetical protein
MEADSSESAAAWFNKLSEAVYRLEQYPNRGRVIPEIRNFAICFLAVSQTSTGSSTPSTNATLQSTFFTFATAHGLRLQLNE